VVGEVRITKVTIREQDFDGGNSRTVVRKGTTFKLPLLVYKKATLEEVALGPQRSDSGCPI
jgi:hypothetical protein